MGNIEFSCVESRIENNSNFYGQFQLGPFPSSQGLTVATALRRILLSELPGLAIICVEIEGVVHEYSTIPGIKDSILDILLNLKEIVFTSTYSIKDLQIGFLYFRGPGIVKAGDLKLPLQIQCVDPEQYIATLSHDAVLQLKIIICEGKNYLAWSNDFSIEKKNFFFYDLLKNNQLNINFKSLFEHKENSRFLPIDAVFMPVKKVNFLIEEMEDRQDRVFLEIWTNGSLHPRRAIQDASRILTDFFSGFLKYSLASFCVEKNNKFIENKLLCLDIGNLNLSLKAYTTLKKSKIESISDILKAKQNNLKLKNIDQDIIHEIKQNFYYLGLKI